MDRVTDVITGGSTDDVRQFYADDATIMTPDQGELRGGDAAAAYMGQFVQAFPDAVWEPVGKYEAGNTAIDEGYFVRTHTGPLELPNGEELPPTGKRVRVRECDVATVENGRITSHRFYYDQMEFLEQLGLAPEA